MELRGTVIREADKEAIRDRKNTIELVDGEEQMDMLCMLIPIHCDIMEYNFGQLFLSVDLLLCYFMSFSMKILELASSRKTIRSFKDTDVSLNFVKKVVNVAREAPSGANYQGWRFTLIQNTDLKRKIRKASETGEKDFYKKVSGEWSQWLRESNINWKKPYLEKAPVLIVVYASNLVPYSKESVWIAIGYMLLALEELGLGTVTYTPSNLKLVEDVLPVPDGYRLEAILPVGYSDDRKPKESREKLDTILEIIA